MTTVHGAVRLRADDGTLLPLPTHRWLGPADAVEAGLLAGIRGPVLDVGCGPGRHLAALRDQGVFALGLDISPSFLAIARARGLNVMERSVFARVPGRGKWRSALLLDGNVGIGGDPAMLLDRLGQLVRPDATMLVEIEPADRRHTVQLVRAEADDGHGPWFVWTTVGPRRLEQAARATGWRAGARTDAADRSFVELTRA
jgi:SAM-dependent methyltransferase